MHFLTIIAFCLGVIWLCVVYPSFRITMAIFAGIVVVPVGIVAGAVWLNRPNPNAVYTATAALPTCTDAQMRTWSAKQPHDSSAPRKSDPVIGQIIDIPDIGRCHVQ
jgi:hypothetical protein